MEINVENTRKFLYDVVEKLIKDAVEPDTTRAHEAYGMMIMCVQLGIINENECSTLMQAAEKRTLSADFEDEFVSGLYRFNTSQMGPQY